jgi:pimeloyl-ACP methyl ester carboxylesterase
MTETSTRGKKARRWLWGCGAFIGTCLIAFVVLGIVTNDPNPLGRWRSPEGQAAYTQAYNEAMQLLPPPSRTLDIPTDYGSVRVYEWVTDRTRSATPIVLVPGFTSGVPMWENNLADLAAAHPVYAMDALGDSGMSVQTAEIEDAADQAAWLDQVIEQLGLPRVHLMGHSFGGWSSANYAVHYPQKVASLILLEPVYVFQSIKLETILLTIPSSLPFLPKSWRDASLLAISGEDPGAMDLNDPVARMISEGSEHYARRIPMPRQITPEQMQAWEMPVYAAMAADSPMHDSEAAVETAKENVERIEVRNWPDATHSLPMEYPQQIDAEILRFIEENEANP